MADEQKKLAPKKGIWDTLFRTPKKPDPAAPLVGEPAEPTVVRLYRERLRSLDASQKEEWERFMRFLPAFQKTDVAPSDMKDEIVLPFAEVAYSTDRGKKTDNQDGVDVHPLLDFGLVTDGMSTGGHGRMATRVVLETFAEWTAPYQAEKLRLEMSKEKLKDTPENRILWIARKAHAAVERNVPKGEEGGAVVAGTLIEDMKLYSFVLGDAMNLVVRQGKVVFCSRPTSRLQRYVDIYNIRPAEVETKLGEYLRTIPIEKIRKELSYPDDYPLEGVKRTIKTDPINILGAGKRDVSIEEFDLQLGDTIISATDGILDPLGLRVIPTKKDNKTGKRVFDPNYAVGTFTSFGGNDPLSLIGEISEGSVQETRDRIVSYVSDGADHKTILVRRLPVPERVTVVFPAAPDVYVPPVQKQAAAVEQKPALTVEEHREKTKPKLHKMIDELTTEYFILRGERKDLEAQLLLGWRDLLIDVADTLEGRPTAEPKKLAELVQRLSQLLDAMIIRVEKFERSNEQQAVNDSKQHVEELEDVLAALKGELPSRYFESSRMYPAPPRPVPPPPASRPAPLASVPPKPAPPPPAPPTPFPPLAPQRAEPRISDTDQRRIEDLKHQLKVLVSFVDRLRTVEKREFEADIRMWSVWELEDQLAVLEGKPKQTRPTAEWNRIYKLHLRYIIDQADQIHSLDQQEYAKGLQAQQWDYAYSYLFDGIYGDRLKQISHSYTLAWLEGRFDLLKNKPFDFVHPDQKKERMQVVEAFSAHDPDMPNVVVMNVLGADGGVTKRMALSTQAWQLKLEQGAEVLAVKEELPLEPAKEFINQAAKAVEFIRAGFRAGGYAAKLDRGSFAGTPYEPLYRAFRTKLAQYPEGFTPALDQLKEIREYVRWVDHLQQLESQITSLSKTKK